MDGNTATRKVASTFGILVGLAGLNHGIFEILQGNATPDHYLIEAIGPAQRFWQYGGERALTIIPSFLISGILATIIGCLVIIWAGWFISRKSGAGILFLLCLALFLVGGGFAPIFMSVLAGLTATQIHSDLNFWQKFFPPIIRRILSTMWPWSLILFVFIFLFSVTTAILGWPLTGFLDADTAMNYLNRIALTMLGVMLVTPLTGFAHDIERDRNHAS